ncbi:hypothetical protein CFIMG_003060RAa [Ceratocystis fimbriata CBS 114723]|uniref:Mitochondrial ATPase complex subunit ATP10 n=1 Tax=Ceratocystis fimbriata CBS 114723 TaxID=1035309 RepID=A0A2C5XAU0_9PEZI|nr:hypothetical protein CFIMG_003060RAa [Ceratocystis fimbriata CBS 114723]
MPLQIAPKRLLWHAAGHIGTRTSTIASIRLVQTEAPKTDAATSAAPKATTQDAPQINAPRSYGMKVEDFTPQPLPRPIGMLAPPRSGQNTGIDPRTLMQKREDLTNWDKHLVRREELKAKISRPYFRDWDNIKMHDGKSFIGPIRVFKAEKSLFFPNLHGVTLENSGLERDTTPVLTGNASIVALLSGRWAESQIDFWINPSKNPELAEVLKSNPEAQIVRCNIEENSIKAWMIKLFMSSIRRNFAEQDWSKYFVIKKGITDEIREHIGYLNSKVGYVYIVDQHCRIRWAGSGPPHPVENESLAKGLQRVVDELKKEKLDIVAKKNASKTAKK